MKHLIDANDIKALTTIQLNTEAHRLEITIPDAEQRHLRPLLGPALFDALLLFIQPETPDTTDELAKLASQVKPMLSQWALVEAWPNLLVHVANAGVVLKTGASGQGTTSADAATLAQVLTAHRDTAIWRGQELVRWLESNKANYPAYASTTPVATGRPPFGGINL